MTGDETSNETSPDDDLQELRAIWLNAESEETSLPDGKADAMLIHDLHQRKSKQSSAIIRRDLLESTAAVLVIFLLGRHVLFDEDINVRFGAMVCVVGACLVIAVLWMGRRKLAHADMAATPREACQRQLQALKHQQKMALLAPFWYVAPVGFGIVWIAVSRMEGWFLYSYLIGCAALFVWVGWLNRRGARKYYQPEIDKMQNLLDDLEE